jgi:hypothetical protein
MADEVRSQMPDARSQKYAETGSRDPGLKDSRGLVEDRAKAEARGEKLEARRQRGEAPRRGQGVKGSRIRGV